MNQLKPKPQLCFLWTWLDSRYIKFILKLFFLVSVINVVVAKTDTSFWAFETLDIWLQSIFFCYSCITWSYLYHSSSFFLSSTSATLTPMTRIIESHLSLCYFFFFLFSSLIKRLGILGRSEIDSFSIKFLYIMIFYCFLSLNFMCNNIGQLTSLKKMLINFMYIET